MPVTTSEESTCPTTCPFYGGGCYAKSGFHLRTHWQKVSKGERGTDWQGLTDFVRSLKPKQIFRHNQAGDMPHMDGLMRLDLLKSLVDANKESGARGYTYTHHLLNTHNKEAIKYANKNGFTINASCESLEQCDEAINNGIPAVCVVNSDQSQCPKTTPAGRKVTICPAQLHDNVTCANCQLCSHSNRSNVVAFLAHGNGKKKVDALLTA
jgi:hypothetical protein